MNLAKMHLYFSRGDWMNIELYPQYQLYLLTLNLLMLKEQILPEDCDEWCINATIINRAYYSSLLYCELWLNDVKDFKPRKPWDFKDDERKIGEHKQVRDALYEFGQKRVQKELSDLAVLRNKADYNPFSNISPKELNEAIIHMEKIFGQLEFE